MPSSTRWRLQFTDSYNSPYVTITELEMASSAGGTDLCTGGTAVASTEYPGGGYEANKAFDNSNSTRWNNAADIPAAWLEYQFSSTVSIVEYRITAPGDSSAGSMPKAWYFQYFDGSIWQTVDTQSGVASWPSGSTRIYNFAPNPVVSVERSFAG